MPEKLITKSFERLLDKGKHRGFITYEELGKSLGKRNSTNENIERAFIILVDEKITLVEKKSQYQSNKKKETSVSSEEKTSDKSDDPIRMYLREMGGVELLSREGEIAIAKRIEAGKDVMINALTQSPIVGKKIFEWKELIENQQMLVRDIIDIDSTYEDFDSSQEAENAKEKKKEKQKKNENLTKQIKSLKIPVRRGPFKEATIHYKDITPIFIKNNNENKFTKKISFGRRPTKSSRRKLEKFMGRNF